MDLAALTAQLADAGFDIAHPFPLREVARETAFAALGRDPSHEVGVLVGNTRVLWATLEQAHASAPRAHAHAQAVNPGQYSEYAKAHVVTARERDEHPHPIDHYTTTTMHRLHGPDVVFAHERDDQGRFFPFQRLAVEVGLAALAPTQLLIHPVYGPWFGLRAVLVGPGTPPRRAPRAPLPCDCAQHECVSAFERAKQTPDDWRAWLAVRDACPVGRAYRYSDPQIAYHYTKDRTFLPWVR